MKYQLIKIIVPSAGAAVKFYANTEMTYKRISGLYISLPYQNSLLGSTLELKIADNEIFPQDFEARMVSCGQEVSPNDRYYNINEEAEGSKVDGRLTDGGIATGVTFPYTAVLYLRLEEKKQ